MKCQIIVLLYSISLTILLGIFQNTQALEQPQNLQVIAKFIDNKIDSNDEIKDLFQKNLNLGEYIYYSTVPRGVIVSINSIVFFEDGKDEIKECSKEILNKIAQILKFIDKPCVIEGNTSKNSYTTSIYRSDWELSMIRAERIADYLIKTAKLKHDQIRAIGFGEFIPYTDKTKKEMNQRIDFVILNYEEGAK